MDKMAVKILAEHKAIVDELLDRDLLIDSCALIPFETEERTMLSWSGGAHLSYLYGEYSTVKNYCDILTQRDFCLCFSDGGLIQIRYVIENEEIVSHRLCYFPCPFSFESEDLEGIALAEIPLLLNAEELRMRLRLASPIHFDFDSAMTDEKHAHAHVSMNKETCRLPAYGPISMGHFYRFVLRYFYEVEFADLNDWEDITPRLYRRTLQHPPPHEFHLDTASSYYV
jgi:hypothetical protein